MLGILDFFVAIFDWLVYWRLGLRVALTGLACGLLCLAIPDTTMRWVICVPLGMAGLFLSIRWQNRSDVNP